VEAHELADVGLVLDYQDVWRCSHTFVSKCLWQGSAEMAFDWVYEPSGQFVYGYVENWGKSASAMGADGFPGQRMDRRNYLASGNSEAIH
jgi:hypothetical protein